MGSQAKTAAERTTQRDEPKVTSRAAAAARRWFTQRWERWLQALCKQGKGFAGGKELGRLQLSSHLRQVESWTEEQHKNPKQAGEKKYLLTKSETVKASSTWRPQSGLSLLSSLAPE